MYHVRRWGLARRPSLLEAIGFDSTPLVGSDAPISDFLHIYLAATHFDLPGGFIIADPDYPLLLFDPAGDLKGCCISYLARWRGSLQVGTWLLTSSATVGSARALPPGDRGSRPRTDREDGGFLIAPPASGQTLSPYFAHFPNSRPFDGGSYRVCCTQ